MAKRIPLFLLRFRTVAPPFWLKEMHFPYVVSAYSHSATIAMVNQEKLMEILCV
jgi:hypothetical protein